jgi:Uma2 family endonuclease
MKIKKLTSKIPSTALEIYRLLPEGTRCEVIFNEMIFPDYTTTRHVNRIPPVPTNAIEVYQMLPEGTRCEVIFNELIMSSQPSREHLFTLIKLTTLLFQFLNDNEAGTLLTAPFDVYLDEQQSVVQPDLFIVLKKDEHTINKKGVNGVPAIIIEIISTNRAYDTQRKRTLYEQAGVKEYFMIDPENKLTTLLTLNAQDVYEQTYEETGLLRSAIINCNISF